MSFQPGANLYTQGFGSRSENVEVPHIEVRDPSATDVNYPIGKRWLNTSSQDEFILYSFSSNGGVTVANWASPVGATGAVVSLSDNNGAKVFPNSDGNISLLASTRDKILINSNSLVNAITFDLADPLIIGGLTTTGTVNLNTTGNNFVNIGNGLSTTQRVSIDAGSQLNLYTNSPNGQIIIGNSSNSGQVFCPFQFFGALDVQGTLTSPDQGISLLNGTFSQTTSLQVISGTFNCTGAEGILYCKPSSAITINLSENAFPGSYVTIYDGIGTAGTNNITINAAPGGQIFQAGIAPSASYVINTNYGNVTFYLIPESPATNYIIFNH